MNRTFLGDKLVEVIEIKRNTYSCYLSDSHEKWGVSSKSKERQGVVCGKFEDFLAPTGVGGGYPNVMLS